MRASEQAPAISDASSITQVLRSEKVSTKCDVYSFGVVCEALARCNRFGVLLGFPLPYFLQKTMAILAAF